MVIVRRKHTMTEQQKARRPGLYREMLDLTIELESLRERGHAPH
jgi:hypothetical protein